jgi:hypothetical protein
LPFSRKKTHKKIDPPGGRVVPPILLPKILFFSDLKPHAKFQKPKITPSGRKVKEEEEERKKAKNAINSRHLVP